MNKEFINIQFPDCRETASFLRFASKGRIINLAVRDVTHISKNGHESFLYTPDKLYVSTQSLQELLHQLPNYFCRIHRSHIISTHYLRGHYHTRVKVHLTFLPLSRYFKPLLVNSLRQQIDATVEFCQHHKTNPHATALETALPATPTFSTAM